MYLEPTTIQHKIVCDTFFTEVIIQIYSQRAMLVVDFPFRGVTEDGVGCVDLFEYFCCLGIPWILVWMILQGQFPTQAIPKRGWGENWESLGRVRVNDRDRFLGREGGMH